MAERARFSLVLWEEGDRKPTLGQPQAAEQGKEFPEAIMHLTTPGLYPTGSYFLLQTYRAVR